jgi:hypothetical protein
LSWAMAICGNRKSNFLILVFTMMCPTRTHFFYMKYFQIATSHTSCTVPYNWAAWPCMVSVEERSPGE